MIYTLEGPDAASFIVDSGTGQLKSVVDLDFESTSTYFLVMYVYDQQGGRDSVVVTVQVTDVAEQQQVQVVVESPVPTPEPEPVQQLSPTPAPTATLEPTPTAAPTPTPQPTPTRQPTPTPEPTPTMGAWWTWTSNGEGAPTVTPQPTATIVPTPTPQTLSSWLLDPPANMLELSEDIETGGASQPAVVESSVAPIVLAPNSLRIWPIVLIVLGAIMEVISIGMFVRGRTEEWVG